MQVRALLIVWKSFQKVQVLGKNAESFVGWSEVTVSFDEKMQRCAKKDTCLVDDAHQLAGSLSRYSLKATEN